MSHALRRRLPFGLLFALSALAISAGPARAGLLTGGATDCSASTSSQVFLQWGDAAEYSLVPGGAFEAGEPSWALTGKAAEVAGNETYDVHGKADRESLSLPAGSSATSPTFCVGLRNPSIRLFVLNKGSALSALAVDINFTGPLGLRLSAPIGLVTAGGTWQPSPVLLVLVNLLTLAAGDQTPVSLTFQPLGGSWQIDDVYFDPYSRT